MQKVNHFSLRKTAMYGLTSCLIGIAFMGAGRTVKADANTKVNAAVKTQEVQVKTSQSKDKTRDQQKPVGNIQKTANKVTAAAKTQSAQNTVNTDNPETTIENKQPALTDNKNQSAARNTSKQNIDKEKSKKVVATIAHTNKNKASAPIEKTDTKNKQPTTPVMNTEKKSDLQEIADAVAPYLKEKDVLVEWFQRLPGGKGTDGNYKTEFKCKWECQTKVGKDGVVKYNVKLHYYYDFGWYDWYGNKDDMYVPDNLLFDKETGYYSNVDDLIAKIKSYQYDFDHASTYENKAKGTDTMYVSRPILQFTKPDDYYTKEWYEQFGGPWVSEYDLAYSYGSNFKIPDYSIIATSIPALPVNRNSANIRIGIDYIGSKDFHSTTDKRSVTRTIIKNMPDGIKNMPDGSPQYKYQSVNFTRTINIIKKVNGQTRVYNTDWRPDSGSWPEYDASLKGYTAWTDDPKADKKIILRGGLIPAVNKITPSHSYEWINVYYTKNMATDKATITRTIIIVNPDKTQHKTVQTVIFTRDQTSDINNGKTIYGPWSENGKHTFAEVDAPILSGYTASGNAPQITVTPDSKDTTVIITYIMKPTTPTTPSQPTQVSQATQPAPVHPTVPPTQPTKPSQQIPPKAAKSPQIAKPGQSAKSGNVKPKATRGGKEGISVEPQSEKGKNSRHKLFVLPQHEQRTQKAEPVSVQPNKQAKMLPQTSQRNNSIVAFGLAILNLGLLILAGLGLRKREN